MTADLISLLAFGAVAFLAGISALFLTAWVDPVGRRRRRAQLNMDTNDGETVFLFEQDRLVDATPSARKLLEAAPKSGSQWTRLIGLLAPLFPNTGALVDLEDKGEVTLFSDDGTTRLFARSLGMVRRISLIDLEEHDARIHVDKHSLAAMKSELDTLRANTDTAPFLVWRETAEGTITWVNRAYLDMVERAYGVAKARSWPPPALFESAHNIAPGDRKTMRRLCLKASEIPGDQWFDCHLAPLGDEVLLTAIDANAAVHAETQLREFMQTLTKTFAHLTVGLAIFDRSRRLALFNPALTDLTGLPVDFLTARPALIAFLDGLRERQMMPEPKDYRTWRKEIAELEAAAADGNYSETWTLGTGQTYRVSGRPHPDGAIAFLFEDISAEISLTRRFRAELEMGQSVIDAVEDAVAVFGSV
ncbi:MAG: PAS-domain containing protein, partial [Pseudomonadota bacterium]